MNIENKDEFIADLKNCKDIEELLKCLSSINAHNNFDIFLVKRDDTQEGFNEDFKKYIELNDFLTEWIEDNNGFFIYDDMKYLIDLIIITNKYLSDKYERTLNTLYKKTPNKQRLNDTKKYQKSVIKHLEAIKRDLELIQPKGAKTKILLDLTNEALNDINIIVPIVKVQNANKKELEKYLTKLEKKIGISKGATRKYITFFQSYNNLEVGDNFYFSNDITHITS